MKFSAWGLAFAAATTLAASSAMSATVTVFTDQTAFENAVASVTTESFNGAESDFGPDSVGGSIGTQTTVDVFGHNGDSSRQGLTGTGFFEGEVDSSNPFSSDGAALNFNTGSIFGFGLVGLQNDRNSTPAGLDLEEIGIVFAGESFIVSDILGLTDSSSGSVNSIENTLPVFVGFLTNVVQTGFDLVHGDLVTPFGVSGGNEEFYVDELLLANAPAVAAVPLPAGLPLLLAGLGGLAMLRRKKSLS